MEDYSSSNERGKVDYVRFGIGFFSFVLAVAGMTIGSPSIAMTGAIILLLVVASFR